MCYILVVNFIPKCDKVKGKTKEKSKKDSLPKNAHMSEQFYSVKQKNKIRNTVYHLILSDKFV